ncbi:taurine ABC transporter substrate-binding protein [Thioclava nitratireducens]|uniref:Taurine ABC transporter substrate-binding protein n=1 Tax=Thioclava nitratireducens TaxID=1915078 RepID=A0ABM6IH59_9RHOB|nr:taurine ABC transporter substrate-binding protein [Thioclava nitratireducens]AQS48028.1 taurine ABC transporter substrate-binding protein [Thioclava nitratireducens]
MNKFNKIMMTAAAALTLSTSALWAETMTIGTFSDPTPMNAARAEKAFEKATGWTIEWRVFNSGTDVIAAMASGDVEVAELGSSPLAIAASQGVDLQMFMVSYAIGDSESLIAHNGSGIKSLEDLKGKRVAVPVGSTAHYSLMGAISHAGMKESDLTIISMPPDQIAAAWDQGTIDAAFIWPPVQTNILETGSRIVSAAQTAKWGYPTFNAWTVNTKFAESHEKEMVAFAKAMNAANKAYLDDPSAWTPDNEKVKEIASVTGAGADQIPGILKGYTFVPLSEQVSDTWLGNAANIMKSTAEFLKSAGRIDSVADDYSAFVNTKIAEDALK